jgi:glycerol-3-phosphate cytidylyltransferase-like family protein
LNEKERVASAEGCKYVDEVLLDDVELVVTEEFIKKQ